jgi:polyribonucleotide nucleotidyltransferase
MLIRALGERGDGTAADLVFAATTAPDEPVRLSAIAATGRLGGTVRNAVDFGAFVDIGVKQDGLLHRSQLPPGVTLQPGDVIQLAGLPLVYGQESQGLGETQEYVLDA